MPAKNEDLHGNVPDRCRVALLLVDVINPMDFPGGADLAAAAQPAAARLADAKRAARAAGVPVIYANDNYGRWRSSLQDLVHRCTTSDVPGRPVAELLRPEPDDYVVLKPKHSAFYATPLELLLRYLGTDVLVLGGFAAHSCVLFTAADAFLRDFHLIVLRDGVASPTPELTRTALAQMAHALDAQLRTVAEIDWRALATPAAETQRSGEPDRRPAAPTPPHTA